MRRAWLSVAALAGLALPVGAQEALDAPKPAGLAEAPAAPQFLLLSQDRLFAESAFGQAALARVEAALRALQAENRRIEADLEAEEKALTEQRQTTAPNAFRQLAEAFDAKVEGIRNAQDAKARTIAQQRETERQRFYEAAVPVLAEMMAEQGAVAILDKGAVVLSFDRIDMTDAAIRRMDAVLGDGSTPPAAP